ncbi:TadE/TadG family type IV pilus assembly protein [Sphingomonas faeni]|uniref:TadE/TadG family type IV pilus assembly protein n=1 Tax=Sphingomonas faeni TaxID=185950 RepID=UPI003352692E
MRLVRDRRGNTLAMMAAFLLPLLGLAGSAVDVARLYVVKARLQQACDAGVLAGRKFMTSTDSTLDAVAVTQAKNFFSNNFKTGWMGGKDVTFTPTKTSDSQVAGIAAATVPMTLMKIFNMSDVTIAVNCQARYDVADTDVMFVLDTTGSMACLPGGPDTCGTGTYAYTRPTSGGVPGYAGSTGYAVKELFSNGSNASRIDALRKAVLSFYDAFAANADPATNVRYGFVSYSSVVNAGQAILDVSPSYLVGSGGSFDQPNYQSRHVYADYTISISDTRNNKTQENCTAPPVRTPSAVLTYNPSSSTATKTYDIWRTQGAFNSNSYFCYTRTETLGPKWEYKKLQWDVSSLVNGASSMTDPTAVDGSKTQWLGCVETPVETPGQTIFVAGSLPSDLDPDAKPSGATRWWPHMQDIEYWRTAATDYSNGDDNNSRPSLGSPTLAQTGYSACGKPVKRLGVMARSDVYNYLYATDFVAQGGTYHDTGMIWGSRLISPTGAWAKDTATWSGRNPPNRVIVFLTDGVMSPNSNSYSMYGYEDYDKRVANGDTSNLTSYHNARFLAACAAAKARKVDVWTVAIATSTSTPLQTCATTTNQALFTPTGNGLSAAFTSIAQHLAMLRITK